MYRNCLSQGVEMRLNYPGAYYEAYYPYHNGHKLTNRRCQTGHGTRPFIASALIDNISALKRRFN